VGSTAGASPDSVDARHCGGAQKLPGLLASLHLGVAALAAAARAGSGAGSRALALRLRGGGGGGGGTVAAAAAAAETARAAAELEGQDAARAAEGVRARIGHDLLELQTTVDLR
jgi:hypothetical protein